MKTIIEWGLRLLLAGVLGFAGAAKLRDPAAFATDIENFHLLSSGFSALLAVYLPWLELLLAAGLLLPRWKVPAALLTTGLFAVFTIAVALAWMRGLDIECGCFGHIGAAEPLRWVVLRDAALFGGAFRVLRLGKIKTD